MRPGSRHVQRGLSLLEVILALAILAGAMVVLSQLVNIGIQGAMNARELTKAQLLCESLSSEIAAGVFPAEPMQRIPLDFEPGWVASVEVLPTEEISIYQLVVMVERDSQSRRATRFSLMRWIRDPNLEIPSEEESDATDSTANESSSSDFGSSNAPATGSPRGSLNNQSFTNPSGGGTPPNTPGGGR